MNSRSAAASTSVPSREPRRTADSTLAGFLSMAVYRVQRIVNGRK
jgi:hypothetical protein